MGLACRIHEMAHVAWYIVKGSANGTIIASDYSHIERLSGPPSWVCRLSHSLLSEGL